MLYTYECPQHGEFDVQMSVAEMAPEYECPHCGKTSKKIIVPSHGGIQCDSAIDVPWLDFACNTLLPDDHPPLETRGEFKRYLKDNGITERA